MGAARGNEPAAPTLGDAFMQVADGSWQPKSHYGMQGDLGLTIREELAARAMQGLCANPALSEATEPQIAAAAVKQADELLAALYPEKNGRDAS